MPEFCGSSFSAPIAFVVQLSTCRPSTAPFSEQRSFTGPPTPHRRGHRFESFSLFSFVCWMDVCEILTPLIFEVLPGTVLAVRVDGYVQLGGDTLATYDERTTWLSSKLTSVIRVSYNVTSLRCMVVEVSVLHFHALSRWSVQLPAPECGAFQQLGANTAATVPRARPLTLPDSPRSRSPAGEPDS